MAAGNREAASGAFLCFVPQPASRTEEIRSTDNFIHEPKGASADAVASWTAVAVTPRSGASGAIQSGASLPFQGDVAFGGPPPFANRRRFGSVETSGEKIEGEMRCIKSFVGVQ